jgi:Holliday junction resolvase RusA-like endonuclease
MISITIGSLPPAEFSPNSRVHWARKHEARILAHDEVIALVAEQGWHGPAIDHAQVTVSWGVNDKRRRDTDNFVGRTKPYIDGLVHAGVLVDDSSRNVIYQFQWHEAKQKETIITVTPCPIE